MFFLHNIFLNAEITLCISIIPLPYRALQLFYLCLLSYRTTYSMLNTVIWKTIVDKKTVTPGMLRYWDTDIFLRGIGKYFPSKYIFPRTWKMQVVVLYF